MNELEQVKQNNELVEQKQEEQQLLVDELKYQPNQDLPYEERAKNVATVIATKKAFDDNKFIDEITENKKKELTEISKTNLKSEKAKSKDADKELQKSLFGIYEGLSGYMGIKRELPQIMLKGLMFIAQPILTIVFLAFGLITGIINICMDALNSIVERFANLADSTKKLIRSLFVIALIGLAVYLIKYGLEYFNIIKFN